MEGVRRTVLVLSIVCIWVSVGLSETCEMLPSAGDFFSVQFETGRRGEIKSLDTIEVTAYFNNIVDEACADDLVLTMLQPDGTWTEVEDEKQNKKDRKRRERFFLWKVSEVVPCRTNKFMLMSGEHSIEAELAPAELEDLEDFEFSPGKTQNIEYANDELKWEVLECATNYQVEIINIETGEEVRSEIVNENKIRLNDLEYCEEFEYYIFPFVGEFESVDDEGYGEFIRQPNIDVLRDLEIQVEASENTAVVSWEISKQISCVDKYEVEVCEADDNAVCQTEAVYSPVEDLMFRLPIEGLRQATAYRVVLKALYRGNEYYKDIKSHFNTKLDLEGFKVEAIADFDTVTITWSDVAIAHGYTLSRQYEDGEWVTLAEVADDVTFQSEEKPCMNIAYAVTVVTSETIYDKKESNTVNLQLDESLPFLPTEQTVFMDIDGATLSWTHLACIDAYEVHICDELMIDCSSNITLASELCDEDGLILDIEDLIPCTTYNVEIIPRFGVHSWIGDPLALQITTGMSLTPPPQDSVHVEPWTPRTPVWISWENTSCAESYEIFFEDTMDPDNYFYNTTYGESVVFESPDQNSCTEYEFQIVAVAGENRSEDSTIGHFFVGPKKSSLQEIKPDIVVGIYSVDITIPMSRALRCIEQYSITICTADGSCPTDEVIENNADGFTFNTEDLTSATDYTVRLIPLYEGEKLRTEDEAFSQDISTLMNLEGLTLETDIEAGQDDLVHLEWQEVYGADEYEIGQQYGADEVHTPVMVTSEVYMTTEQAMCSTATYTLTVKRQGLADQTTIHSSQVTTFLNDTEPYMASNLNIDMEENTTKITWDHLGPCVASYSIFLNEDQVDEEYTMTMTGDSQVSVSLDSLENCKQFKLKIVPVFTNTEMWEAEPEVQQEFKRLDDKRCVIPKKVPRHAMKQRSGSSSLSSPAVGQLVLLLLISATVRCLPAL